MTMSTPELRLVAAGYTLPSPPQPRGAYAPVQILSLDDHMHLVSASGQTCRVDGVPITGTCASGDSLEPARSAARVAMLNLLAAIAAAHGGQLPPELRVKRMRGFVRATSDFTAHTAVLDAASELLTVVWPDAPIPARTAVGVSSLPGGALVEIELDALMLAPRK